MKPIPKAINRRKAIISILVGLVAMVSFFIAFKWFRLKTYQVDLAFFDKEFPLLSAITEVILPETDVPGAIAAGVPQFIMHKINGVLSDQERRTIALGLQGVNRSTNLRYGKDFVRCSFEEQTAMIKYLSWKELKNGSFLFKVKRKVFGNSFFYLMKQLTVEGYCTSRRGVTEGLAYDPIPGDYLACVPYQPHQKAWAQK
jgi:hypothetical protein